MEMTSIASKLGGRKFVLGLISIIVLALLACFKPEALTSTFITGILGIIAAFNVSNVTTAIKANGQPNNVSPYDDSILKEQLKVELLYLQDQLSKNNERIDKMADIIQNSLLTKPNSNSILQGQSPTSPAVEQAYQNDNKSVSQADINRQAISEFLKSNFGQG